MHATMHPSSVITSTARCECVRRDAGSTSCLQVGVGGLVVGCWWCSERGQLPAPYCFALALNRNTANLCATRKTTTTQFPRRLIKENAEVRQSKGSFPPFPHRGNLE
jgi:hypothetical protein